MITEESPISLPKRRNHTVLLKIRRKKCFQISEEDFDMINSDIELTSRSTMPNDTITQRFLLSQRI